MKLLSTTLLFIPIPVLFIHYQWHKKRMFGYEDKIESLKQEFNNAQKKQLENKN
jgi:hypothetical protein